MDRSGKDAQGDGIVAPEPRSGPQPQRWVGEAWGEGGGYRRSAACGTYKKRVSGNFWRAAGALRSQGEGAWEGPQVPGGSSMRTNTYGQLGINPASTLTFPVTVFDGISDIYAGFGFGYLLASNGSVFSAGDGTYGSVGLNTTNTNNYPYQQIPYLNNVVAIQTGYYHGIFITSNKEVYVVGDNSYGELGLGSASLSSVPVLLPYFGPIQPISFGSLGYMSILIKSLPICNGNTTLTVSGTSFYGESGLGSIGTQNSFVQSTYLNGVSQLASGYNHSLAICQDGTLKVFGNNNVGQLGIPYVTEQQYPAILPIPGTYQGVYAGGSHSMVLLSDGTVYAFGNNNYGQLGIVNDTNTFAPNLIPNLAQVKDICLGDSHSLFLLANSSVLACGNNMYGQLGLGDIISRNTPTLIPALSGVSSIACGAFHSLFLLNNGSVLSTGNNYYGQLCIGDFSVSFLTTPQMVDNDNYSNIYSGGSFVYLKDSSGTIKACGNGLNGVLGQGNTQNYSSPIVVPLTNVVSINTGLDHVTAILNNGTVVSCGDNSYGQLGIGLSTSNVLTFQSVLNSQYNFLPVRTQLSHNTFLIENTLMPVTTVQQVTTGSQVTGSQVTGSQVTSTFSTTENTNVSSAPRIEIIVFGIVCMVVMLSFIF